MGHIIITCCSNASISCAAGAPALDVSQENQEENTRRSSCSSGRTLALVSGSSSAFGNMGLNQNSDSSRIMMSLLSDKVTPRIVATGMPPEGFSCRNDEGLSP